MNSKELRKVNQDLVLDSIKRITKLETMWDNDEINYYADEILIRDTADMMRKKLTASREKGRGGWWDDKACSLEELKKKLDEHIAKGDYLDVVNLAAMINFRILAGDEFRKRRNLCPSCGSGLEMVTTQMHLLDVDYAGRVYSLTCGNKKCSLSYSRHWSKTIEEATEKWGDKFG